MQNLFCCAAILAILAATTDAFVLPQQCKRTTSTTTVLQASFASRNYARGGGGQSSNNSNINNNSNRYTKHRGNDRTKRQERVGTLVQTELSNIIHKGVIRGDAEYLDDDLRQRISVVSADVSPDLKQARISVSIRGPNKRNTVQKVSEDEDDEEETDFDDDDNDYDYDDNDYDLDNIYVEDEHDPAVDQRRAYSWLVRNTKPIRHTLAQRMSHMKSCPNLSFVQVDVAAATDVMYLIDKVAKGYKRDRIGGYGENDMPTGVLSGMDFDEDFDDDDWDEEDDFFTK